MKIFTFFDIDKSLAAVGFPIALVELIRDRFHLDLWCS